MYDRSTIIVIAVAIVDRSISSIGKIHRANRFLNRFGFIDFQLLLCTPIADPPSALAVRVRPVLQGGEDLARTLSVLRGREAGRLAARRQVEGRSPPYFFVHSFFSIFNILS